VRKSKADKVKRIQEGFKRFDLLRKPESSGSTDKLFAHSTSVNSAIDTYMFEKKGDVNLITFSSMLQHKVISKQMALKMSRSGLSLGHLRLAVDRGGRDGLYHLFTEKVNGKVRVTSANRIVQNVFNFVCPN
jgi:hypothetical protein